MVQTNKRGADANCNELNWQKPRAARRGTLALLKQSRPWRKARAAGCGALHSSSPSVPQYSGMRSFASETCEMRTHPSTCAINTQGSGCEGSLAPRRLSIAGGRRCREHSGVPRAEDVPSPRVLVEYAGLCPRV